MKKKGFTVSMDMLFLIFLVMLAVNAVIMSFYSTKAMFISIFLLVVGAVLTILRAAMFSRYFKRFIALLDDSEKIGSKALSNFKMPVVYTNSEDEILWYNQSFKQFIAADKFGENISSLISMDKTAVSEKGCFDTALKGKEFTVYTTKIEDGKNCFNLYLFADNTRLKRAAREYFSVKPAVMMISTDNFNETVRNFKDSVKSSFLSAIRKEIENWLTDVKCVSINSTDNGMYVILHERDLKKLIEGQFEVLKNVRTLSCDGASGVTLSVGVGRGGKNIAICEELCKQALEMAQSRGGDQVVIKNNDNEYRFFGGVANAVEKSNKVRVRVVASAMEEMIKSADKVILMGHKYSDLDSLGASYALAEISASYNKKTYIVIDESTTLAVPLLKRISQNSDIEICDGNNIEEVESDKTLLIVSDTHRAVFCENPALFEKVKNVIVIDHHRKSVDAIDNAVIFYHETAASSACEMVGELLPYFKHSKISPLAADALLGGITLDTKNFCLHTGVRTFEAAAYIKNCGADTVRVKHFFADNKRTYLRKAQVVSAAQLYKNVAISAETVNDDITRIVASQAADELLNLENVKASFVICPIKDGMNVSARSLGEINVQVIMEALGGGGHSNMAACQLSVTDFDTAKRTLVNILDKYI